jgi:hypothetical protein
MDELELWGRGLMTLALGPDVEWHPAIPAEHQWFHAQFWAMVLELVPDNEDDEPYWMTEDAASRLAANHHK